MKECPVCDKPFEPKATNQKYCSPSCRNKHFLLQHPNYFRKYHMEYQLLHKRKSKRHLNNRYKRYKESWNPPRYCEQCGMELKKPYRWNHPWCLESVDERTDSNYLFLPGRKDYPDEETVVVGAG